MEVERGTLTWTKKTLKISMAEAMQVLAVLQLEGYVKSAVSKGMAERW